MNVSVLSFGFKYGVPLDLDLLFDVRFLENPNYEADLQPLTGNDPEVGAFIERDPSFAPFLSHLFPLVDFLLPQYAQRGRERLTIAFGCTGGRHRSVYVAQRLVAHLRDDPRWSVTYAARDVELV